ncbi:hypothetical protein, conserved [Leishmania tarentolae]|uniref:Uncharacterized protein n=1 Tax=Leishmania tarentolae TaxID=5689 RepID=A0A640KIJ1_LEITA|nr:hypothetical protein, conserved [Leishmania tarentolae]
MFRWTAGTKARADRASRQHGYPGGPTRLLLARRRHLHSLPSDTVTLLAPTAGTGSAVATVSQSSAHSCTERGHSSPLVSPSTLLVRDDAAADTAAVPDSAAFSTVVEEAAQTSACPPPTTTDISSPILDPIVREVVMQEDGRGGNTRQISTTDAACSLRFVPSLSHRCSAAPPSPSPSLPSPPLDVVVNLCGDLPEHPSSASASSRFQVLLGQQQPLLPPPPLPSLHPLSTTSAERLAEAVAVKTARQRRRGHTLERSSRHQREGMQRHKRHRRGENPDDDPRDINAVVESSEEEMADTYAKVQEQQHQRQRMEKQAVWGRWQSSSIDDFSDPHLNRRGRIIPCEEQWRQPHSRLHVAEQSVDSIAVQLPLQRAKDAPVSTITHTAVLSPSDATSHLGAPSSSSLACSEWREAHTRIMQEESHSLPRDVAIEVAADTFRRDTCSNTLSTCAKVNFCGGVAGRPLHPFESSLGCRDGRLGAYNANEGVLPLHVSPFTLTVGLPMKCPEYEMGPIFEDHPLNWCPQPQVQAAQQVVDEYASTPAGLDRAEGDKPLRCGVVSLLGPDSSAVEPASTLARTLAGDDEADLWMPQTGSHSFTPWHELGADCGTCVGAYGLPPDRVMAVDRDLVHGFGDTRARFYGGTSQEPGLWLSSPDYECHAAENEPDWQYQVGCCPTLAMRSSNASALPVPFGINTEAPPSAGLFSSHAVPGELLTTPAFPWMTADEGLGVVEVGGTGGDGDWIFERAPPPCPKHHSLERAMRSDCGHGDVDGGNRPLYSAPAPPPLRSHRGSSALQPRSGHSPPFSSLTASANVVGASSNIIASAPSAPYRVGRAARQRRRHSDGAQPPRALTGTTERCRRFWQRCRQSHVPNM